MKKEERWLLDEKYKGEKSEGFFADLEKLKTGEPLAFLIGHIDFINTRINLEFRPLIPRPETEFWIYEYIFPKIKEKEKEDFASQNPPQEISILDIFSGSGCIGLSLLNNFENVSVDFGEIKKENILQIKKNIQLNKLSVIPRNNGEVKNKKVKRCQIFQSDIFEKIPPKKYDFILANPPYISKKRKNTIQKSVLDFEDKLALFANDDGLYFIKKTILGAEKFLKKNGELWIEFDPWQKEKIKTFLKENQIKKFHFFPDQYKKNRFLQIIFE